MNFDHLMEDLKRDEGWSPFAYQDTEGFWTIGFGFLVDERKGVGLPKEIGEQWLTHAVMVRWNEFVSRKQWILDQPEDVQRAIANMTYQLGVNGVLNFKRMLAALKDGNRNKAANEAMDSKWALQTPNRAQRVSDLMRGG